MDAPEKIQVTLSPFEKLQILRDELEDRKKELTEVESEIREKAALLETQRYLETLSPYYAANPRPNLPTHEEVAALEKRRVQLYELAANIEATIPVMLKSAGSKDAPTATAPASAPGAPARKAKFDSFDDFKKARS